MTEQKLPTVKKMEPHGLEWQRLANKIAREEVDLIACKHCNHPVIRGYCCSFCGSSDPR